MEAPLQGGGGFKPSAMQRPPLPPCCCCSPRAWFSVASFLARPLRLALLLPSNGRGILLLQRLPAGLLGGGVLRLGRGGFLIPPCAPPGPAPVPGSPSAPWARTKLCAPPPPPPRLLPRKRAGEHLQPPPPPRTPGPYQTQLAGSVHHHRQVVVDSLAPDCRRRRHWAPRRLPSSLVVRCEPRSDGAGATESSAPFLRPRGSSPAAPAGRQAPLQVL